MWLIDVDSRPKCWVETLRQAVCLSAVRSRPRAFDLWAIGAVNQLEEWLFEHVNPFFQLGE
jgi:hypothetical protein